MKRLGFRASFLSTDKNARAGTKPSQTTNYQLFYIVCVPSMGIFYLSEGLRKRLELPAGFYDGLFAKDWVVYCKRPFYGPSQVIEYLGRYTHKVAIGNYRLKSLEDGGVSFSVKDYRSEGKKSSVRVSVDAEFIRRFALHNLPRGFVRIRHYGILNSCKKKGVLPTLREQLGATPVTLKPPVVHRRCPACKAGRLVTVLVFGPRGPPGG